MAIRGTRRIAVAFLLVVSLGCAACGSSQVRNVTGDGTTTTIAGVPGPATTTSSFRPRFVPAACVSGVPDDSRIACGWLVTREDRTRATGPTVRLPVAIIRGTSAQPSIDPVVYLSGGPGQSGLAGVEGFLDQGYAGACDVIAFDQRGTGGALPNLNCPEVERATRATFVTADPAPAEEVVMAAGFAACHRRLVAEGVDLAAFRTETSADDVADLVHALGYEQVNLYGASYGSALALTVMRRHPGIVRSVTLDGVYPTSIPNGPADVARNARRAVDALVAGCDAAPSCTASAPDLAHAIDQVLSRYDTTPYAVTVTDPLSGKPLPVMLTGPDIMAGIIDDMYQPSGITALPAGITALVSGSQSEISTVVAQGIDGLTSLSEGMAASVECADRARLTPAGGLTAVVASDPAMSTLDLIGDIPGICREWGVPAADAAFSTPVRSNIPTLLLSGAYDPVTPPSNATEAARDLSHAHLVLFPAGGHGQVFASACAAHIFQAFLATPARMPDSACAATPASPWPG